jgi:hypothetical protein
LPNTSVDARKDKAASGYQLASQRNWYAENTPPFMAD